MSPASQRWPGLLLHAEGWPSLYPGDPLACPTADHGGATQRPSECSAVLGRLGPSTDACAPCEEPKVFHQSVHLISILGFCTRRGLLLSFPSQSFLGQAGDCVLPGSTRCDLPSDKLAPQVHGLRSKQTALAAQPS